MSKLPNIYKNRITKNIKNNKEIYRVNEIKKDEVDKLSIIDELFKKGSYPFTKDLIITTSSKIYNTNIINKTENTITTIDGDNLYIDDIIDIQIKKS